MKNFLLKNKGFTLVEVIVSMAILALIATAFVPLFGFSFTNIFSYGERDKAMSVASDIMEELYATQPFSEESKIADFINDDLDLEDLDGNKIAGNEVDNENELRDDYDNKNVFNYLVKDNNMEINGTEINGYEVTIVVFYKNGERHVTLTSFVRGE